MPKKLVIFCDGTWNEPIERGTNVMRTMQATANEDLHGNPQVLHYIAGVGTRGGEKVAGGVFGRGISENIADAYSFIVSNYEKDDEIYLFGFSRGAYTARSIAGLVHNFGILKRYKLYLVREVYDHYKKPDAAWKPGGDESKKFREENCHPYPANIRFLGVWDTVGALGAPYGELTGWLVDKLFGCSFHDVTLSDSVQSAYHAMAADERRWPFRPTNIDLTAAHRARNDENMAREGGFPLYEEKWFPGVHSDVGGGYKEYGLSDGALEWMVGRARQNGLNIAELSEADFSPDRRFNPDNKQAIHHSQKLYYQVLTLVTVKILSLVYPWKDRPLRKNVTWKGEYIRPIRPGADVDAVKAKKDADPTYKPKNV